MQSRTSNTAGAATAGAQENSTATGPDCVIINDELAHRPARSPDHLTENLALTSLMQDLARSPAGILQRVAEAALQLCQAHSAGISLLEGEGTGQHFVWRALAGEWRRFLGGTMPRESSPCGTVLDRQSVILMAEPARYYAIPAEMTPPIVEALLLPFFVDDKAVGTLWLLSHDARRRFDREDVRLMSSLCRFASAAWQVHTAQLAERTAREQVEAKTIELERLSETSAVGLTRCTRDLRFQSVNRAYAELVGMPAAEIAGRPIIDVIGHGAWQVVAPHIRRVLEGQPVEYQAEVPLRTGRRSIHVNYTPDLDASGAVIGWIASVMDVTERRRVEQAAARSSTQKDALYQLADSLQRARTLTDVYKAALRAIVDALGCARASILLFDDANFMRFVAWTGLSDEYRRRTDGHSPWRHDEAEPAPLIVSDVRSAALDVQLRDVIQREGIGALAFIPLVVNGRLIGKFMTYWDQPHTPSDDDIELGLTIARQLAFAVDRQRAEELLRSHASQLALITDTAPVFICYCDAQVRYRFVNRPYAERFGLDPEACIGKRVADVIGQRGYEAIRVHVERVLAGIPVEFETNVTYDAPFGTRFMHCAYAPHSDSEGNVIGFVAAITDITDRRRIEEALQRSEEKLREADRRKDEFLAMLAHELRNPLAPIANAVHLLRAEGNANPTSQQAQAIIERQAARLARLVDDLLEVSRISTGRIQLHMEQVALSGIVERAVETVRPLIEQHRHRLSVAISPEPMWLHADAARLEQVLVNLLNNAAKYTNDGGDIRVVVEQASAQAVIRVLDNGIGIEPELLPRVFDLFTQAERSLDRSQGGLGIGLSLVHRLVLMHGGTVDVHSTPGVGSEFIVRLPLVATRTADRRDTQTRARDSIAPLRVLVVDDNIDAAQSLAMLLETAGHTVMVAHDGHAALSAIQATAPQIVFLDIGLPQVDGYEVARRVRETYPEQIVMVAITGYGQEADRERSREVGFDHHLVKPADLARLEDIVRETGQRLAL